MRNKIIAMILAFAMAMTLLIGVVNVSGKAEAFNMQIFDTTWSFDSVQIEMPNGLIVSGPVDSWKDYDDSDAIQVVVDGKTYYTHLSRVVLYNK